MKWTYIIRQKVKVALAVLAFLLLLLLTHINDKKHFATLHESLTSVYEDRLMAEAYVYEMASELNARKMALLANACSEVKENDFGSTNKIARLISDFKETTLTEEESLLLNELIQEFDALDAMEERYVRDSVGIDATNTIKLQFDKINEKLSGLSNIQVKEGRKLMASSNSIKASSYLNGQTEIVILIIAGLCVQVLIFAQRSSIPRIPQHSRLN